MHVTFQLPMMSVGVEAGLGAVVGILCLLQAAVIGAVVYLFVALRKLKTQDKMEECQHKDVEK